MLRKILFLISSFIKIKLNGTISPNLLTRWIACCYTWRIPVDAWWSIYYYSPGEIIVRHLSLRLMNSLLLRLTNCLSLRLMNSLLLRLTNCLLLRLMNCLLLSPDELHVVIAWWIAVDAWWICLLLRLMNCLLLFRYNVVVFCHHFFSSSSPFIITSFIITP